MPAASQWIARANYQYRRTPQGTRFRIIESDGDRSRWPGKDRLVPNVGPAGERDHYIPLGTAPGDSREAEHKRTYDGYRGRLGRAFAEHVLNKDPGTFRGHILHEWPFIRCVHPTLDLVAEGKINSKACMLEVLPSGYKLFLDVTGRPWHDDKEDRLDIYVFGE